LGGSVAKVYLAGQSLELTVRPGVNLSSTGCCTAAQYALLVGMQRKSTARCAMPAHSERTLQQSKPLLLTLAFSALADMQEQVKPPVILASAWSALQAGCRTKRLDISVKIVPQVLTHRNAHLSGVQTAQEENTQL